MDVMYRVYRWVFGIALAAALPLAAWAEDAPAPAAPAPAASAAKLDPAPASPAVAAVNPPPIESNYILRAFKSKGVTINYLGRMYGLDGWLLTKDSDLQIIYTTLDGQGAVVGTLYGPTGDLETAKQLLVAREKGLLPPNAGGTGVPPPVGGTLPKSAAPTVAADEALPMPSAGVLPTVLPTVATTPAPQPASSSTSTTPASERLWKQVQASNYLKYGSDGAPPFYVFMDPRCHYCHDFYNELTSKYLQAGKLQLRVIPVGILSQDSVNETMKIMSTEDPTKTWDDVEHNNRDGLGATSSDAAAKVRANTEIVNDWKFQGTPTCIYRTKEGKVKMVVGEPSDINAVLSDLGPG